MLEYLPLILPGVAGYGTAHQVGIPLPWLDFFTVVFYVSGALLIIAGFTFLHETSVEK